MQSFSGNEEFFFQGGKQGIVLVHGYTGAPGEMRLLGEYLHQQGLTVLGVRLAGHGTTPQDLNETKWQDWYKAVSDGVYRLQANCDRVSIVGLSMGGLLTIKAAAELPVAKAAILAAPIYVCDRSALYLPLLRFFIRYLKKRQRQYQVPASYSVCYHMMPVKPLSSLFELVDLCKKKYLQSIKIPCLVMQSKVEHTVKPASAQYIYDHLGTADKKLVWYHHSGHILTLDNERDDVFQKIYEFLME